MHKRKKDKCFENLLSSERTLPPNFRLLSSHFTSQKSNPYYALQSTGFDMHWEESQPGSGCFSHSKAVKTSLNRVGLRVVLGLGFCCFSNNFPARKLPDGLCKTSSSGSTCSYGWAVREKSGRVVGFIALGGGGGCFSLFFIFVLSIFFNLFANQSHLSPIR